MEVWLRGYLAPPQIITRIQEECLHIDDQNRWLIALISDTGEAIRGCRLLTEDIVLDQDIPHIRLRKHMEVFEDGVE